MKVFHLSVILLYLVQGQTWGQPWYYSFGTGTGAHLSGVSETFLPTPPTGGGTARVRVGSGGGGFYLDNPGNTSLGSQTELRGLASSSTSINKFSIYDYSPGKAFTIRFDVEFSGSASGWWTFFQGDGNCFSDNSQFSSTEVFCGLRWVFEANNSLQCEYHNGSNWVILENVMVEQNRIYRVEIYGNNTTATVYYNYNTIQSLAPGYWDLWVDGQLVGDELSKAGLAADTTIDSYMFYGGNSINNTAAIRIDDIYYTNVQSDHPLPVRWSEFDISESENGLCLTWQTEYEQDIVGFEIWRALEDLSESQKIASYINEQDLCSAGEASTYVYLDQKVRRGCTYHYRIAAVDISGKKCWSPWREGALTFPNIDTRISPNPFNQEVTIRFRLPATQSVQPLRLEIYDVQGRLMNRLMNRKLEGGREYNIRWQARDNQGKFLSSGIYILHLSYGKWQKYDRLLLLR